MLRSFHLQRNYKITLLSRQKTYRANFFINNQIFRVAKGKLVYIVQFLERHPSAINLKSVNLKSVS
jgi:hypothetical protein